jgi:hypothetical protein
VRAICLILPLFWLRRRPRRRPGVPLPRRSSFSCPGKLRSSSSFSPRARGPDGRRGALRMRHSQGDRRDLLLLFPMGKLRRLRRATDRGGRGGARVAEHPEKIRRDCPAGGRPRHRPCADGGPTRFAGAAFFHVEMFHAPPAAGRPRPRARDGERLLEDARPPDQPRLVRDQGPRGPLHDGRTGRRRELGASQRPRRGRGVR